ncbi:MAG: AraC family transcriptional regulator, partial [Pedobacter sp.]
NQRKCTNSFDFLMGGAIIYLLVHAIYVLTVRTFFAQFPYLNLAAPFILCYGPMSYFLLRILAKGELSRATVITHLFIPVIFWTGFLFILILDTSHPFHQGYRRCLSLASLFSFGGYTIYGILKSMRIPSTKKLLVPGLLWILLLMACMLIVSYAHYRYKGNYMGKSTFAPVLLNSMVYSVMLGISLLLLRQARNSQGSAESDELPVLDADEQPNYERSALSSTDMSEIAEKINVAMVQQRIYLDSGLSLSSLASQLKVPPHYLTQTMNMHMGQNFFELVNSHRIQTACELLLQNPPLSLEQVSAQSGFNALPAFSRNFKKITGTTPISYRINSKKLSSSK